MSQSLSTNVRPSRPASLLLHGLDRLCVRLSQALAAAVTLWIIRRDERMLWQMPDYRLKDLGITRADIPRVVREGHK